MIIRGMRSGSALVALNMVPRGPPIELDMVLGSASVLRDLDSMSEVILALLLSLEEMAGRTGPGKG